MRSMISIALLVCSLASALATAQDKPLSYEEAVKPIEREIERAETIDKKFPAALAAHLDYAQLLARYADGNCDDRLTRGASEHDLVNGAENDTASVHALVLPEGWFGFAAALQTI